MTTPRRPSTWYLWVPLLVVLVVVGGYVLLSGRSVQEAPAGSTGPVATGAVEPNAATGSRATNAPADTPSSGLPTITESALPRQARATLSLIRAGGPYPYAQDDGIFGNRERILPTQKRGYYREYTVVTPGEGDRGPRRIIAGGDGDLYWTTDHYASFRQILEGR